jgi:hypothetical protein
MLKIQPLRTKEFIDDFPKATGTKQENQIPEYTLGDWYISENHHPQSNKNSAKKALRNLMLSLACLLTGLDVSAESLGPSPSPWVITDDGRHSQFTQTAENTRPAGKEQEDNARLVAEVKALLGRAPDRSGAEYHLEELKRRAESYYQKILQLHPDYLDADGNLRPGMGEVFQTKGLKDRNGNFIAAYVNTDYTFESRIDLLGIHLRSLYAQMEIKTAPIPGYENDLAVKQQLANTRAAVRLVIGALESVGGIDRRRDLDLAMKYTSVAVRFLDKLGVKLDANYNWMRNGG